MKLLPIYVPHPVYHITAEWGQKSLFAKKVLRLFCNFLASEVLSLQKVAKICDFDCKFAVILPPKVTFLEHCITVNDDKSLLNWSVLFSKYCKTVSSLSSSNELGGQHFSGRFLTSLFEEYCGCFCLKFTCRGISLFVLHAFESYASSTYVFNESAAGALIFFALCAFMWVVMWIFGAERRKTVPSILTWFAATDRC